MPTEDVRTIATGGRRHPVAVEHRRYPTIRKRVVPEGRGDPGLGEVDRKDTLHAPVGTVDPGGHCNDGCVGHRRESTAGHADAPVADPGPGVIELPVVRAPRERTSERPQGVEYLAVGIPQCEPCSLRPRRGGELVVECPILAGHERRCLGQPHEEEASRSHLAFEGCGAREGGGLGALPQRIPVLEGLLVKEGRTGDEGGETHHSRGQGDAPAEAEHRPTSAGSGNRQCDNGHGLLQDWRAGAHIG